MHGDQVISLKKAGNISIELDLEEPIAELAAEAGIGGDFQLKELPCGGNNRVFRLHDGLHSYLLKWYFTHKNDPRNRLHSEFSFSVFAWENGLRNLARPIACSPGCSLALYEFIEGSKISPNSVTQSYVEQAARFFQDLNIHKDKESARRLPIASEACFSIAGHLELVEQRIQNLKNIDPEDQTDRDALAFVSNHLDPALRTIHAQAAAQADQWAIDIYRNLEDSDRCLSPSDFGFHNALAVNDTMRFIDFEYAGWDDPAKTICDFFCQPAIPVPEEYFPHFFSYISQCSTDPVFLSQRVKLLFPVYKIKWCCIILNCFLPAGKERCIFSHPVNGNERKKEQLKKAQKFFPSRFFIR